MRPLLIKKKKEKKRKEKIHKAKFQTKKTPMKRNEYVRCLYPSLHIQSTSVFCDNYANTRAAVDAALLTEVTSISFKLNKYVKLIQGSK